MALNTYYPNYNNPYQQTYNPYMQQPQIPQPIQQPQIPQMQQQNSQPSINWISGDREALAYPVAPNNAVALWSQTEPVVYLKQADATGKPSMKIYDLVERTAAVAPAEEKSYATKDELEHLREEVSRLKTEMSKKKAVARRREEEDDE